MQVKLEQAFYGRGQFGYGILGASAGGKAFGDAVESLCEAIGSPDAFLKWRPFLVNKLYGEYCLMCCVQQGKPDSCGRATVFYHVLIGLASEMSKAGLDAFVLFDKGLFRDVAEEHPETVSVEGRPPETTPARPFIFQYPAVLSVLEPATELVRSVLGADSVRRSWTTFAFHAMPGFDLCALDARVTPPSGVARYDQHGKELSAMSVTNHSGLQQEQGAKKSIALRVSLVVNVLLIIVFAALLVARNSSTQPPSVPHEGRDVVSANDSIRQDLASLKESNEKLSAENAALKDEVSRLQTTVKQKESVADGLVSREVVINELREAFSDQYRGKRQGELTKDRYPAKVIDAYNPYIRFVNEKIIDSSFVK